MKQTQNYQLSQWEKTDRIQMEDFNGDNAKIEAALAAVDARLAILDRVMPDLTYYTGQLMLQDLLRRKKYLPQRAMLCEAFLYPEELILTGSAVVQNGALTLPGANQTGSMTTLNLSLRDSDWTTAKLWLRCSIGNENVVTPYLNGNEMTRTGTSIDRSATGVQCAEREYTWEGEGVSHAELRLELASGSKAMLVYDYFIVFW